MLKLIACNVFMREACHAVASSPHVIDVDFTELGEHSRSDGLRQIIQSRIDATEASGKKYEAILLLFGLCGNGTVGIEARGTPLVMPRAHDCCTILLGSRAKFVEHFGTNPSTPFSSCGYLERGEYFLRTAEDGTSSVETGDALQAYIKQYGEEDGRYIWEEMHPQHAGNQNAVFIELPETSALGHADKFMEKAQASGKNVRKLVGDIRLIKNLIHGTWNEDEFLIVPPSKKIQGVYDHDKIVRVG